MYVSFLVIFRVVWNFVEFLVKDNIILMIVGDDKECENVRKYGLSFYFFFMYVYMVVGRVYEEYWNLRVLEELIK